MRVLFIRKNEKKCNKNFIFVTYSFIVCIPEHDQFDLNVTQLDQVSLVQPIRLRLYPWIGIKFYA